VADSTEPITMVMPVFNALRFFSQVLPALSVAAERHGGVELVFVDNGSTDGSAHHLRVAFPGAVVLEAPGKSISALRNLGAARATSRILSFIDSDCLVAPDYFVLVVKDLQTSGAAATGHLYALPEDARWIELVWHHLHHRRAEAFVKYLPGGNLTVKREAFESVGGFREDVLTGEDAELGKRLNAAGFRIHSNPDLVVRHLGNPKSLRHFFRREVWHGVGMFATVDARSIDRPTAMMFTHLVFTIAGGTVLLDVGSLALWSVLGVAIGSQLAVPLLNVAYRAAHGGRVSAAGFPRAVFLYWLYYWARLKALALILGRRASQYRK
jgi:GT2 family glycosyltransferase